MTNNVSSGDNILEGSMEQLTLETDPPASYLDSGNNSNADNIDFWGEDEMLNSTADDGSSLSSALDREWNRRREQFLTMGYRDGITAGKETSAQEGFNVGFTQSVHSGYNWGLVRGISSVYVNLPEHLKDKLAATPKKRERLQNLHQSAKMISASEALKMFHRSLGEPSSFSELDGLFKELISLLHDTPEIDIKLEPAQHSTN